jgi:predicted membrane-bound dolichyl-phosphate-mannose-protein mannosyltransferase
MFIIAVILSNTIYICIYTAIVFHIGHEIWLLQKKKKNLLENKLIFLTEHLFGGVV